jgi:hypothetical protein
MDTVLNSKQGEQANLKKFLRKSPRGRRGQVMGHKKIPSTSSVINLQVLSLGTQHMMRSFMQSCELCYIGGTHYLLHQEFILHQDHEALKHIRSQPNIE